MSFSSELKVGLFIITGSAVLVTTAVTLGGNPFFKSTQHFHTILKNAGGVGERTQIRASGVQVGEVTKVEITPEGALIDFDVDSNVKVPDGSYINIKSRGILGDVYIEIERGAIAKGHAEPGKTTYLHSGDLLPLNPESNDMETLVANLNSVVRDIKKVSTTLADVLGTSQGEMSLKNIVENIEKITGDLREVTSSQKMNMKEAIQGIRDSAVRISNLLEKNDSKINQIVSDIKTFSTQLRLLSTKENREKIEKIIANINDTAASLKRMSAKVEKGEGTLGQLIVKDDTANEVKATLKSIQDVVKPLTKLHLTMYDRSEARVANAVSGDIFSNEFDVLFSTRPDRYYLLGAKGTVYGRSVSDASTRTSTNGNTTTVNTQTNNPESVGSWAFNLQLAQRFGPLALRLGLFESSAGFAADFYAFDDMLRTSVEFYHFGGSPTPSDTLYGNKGALAIKAYANLFLLPNIFITGGVDNLILYSSPFPFVGAGFSLTDDDIRGLLGVAIIGSSR